MNLSFKRMYWILIVNKSSGKKTYELSFVERVKRKANEWLNKQSLFSYKFLDNKLCSDYRKRTEHVVYMLSIPTEHEQYCASSNFCMRQIFHTSTRNVIFLQFII